MSESITTTAAVELLSELVRCPSVNPVGAPVLGAPFGEARIVELLAGKVRALGGEAEVRLVQGDRGNMVGRFEGRDSSRSLMLEAHCDTVAADGMTVDPFGAEVRDGKLYGRGSCDTKASITAMLLGIGEVLATDGALPTTVYFVSTCDEEIGASGPKALVAGDFRPDAAIVGEPTDLEIVHASKGSVRLRIETFGRAAHSSAPDDGVNAICKMARIVTAIDRIVAPQLTAKRHDVLGSPTVSVGVIAGGRQVNIVPDYCRMMVDRRLIPGETAAEAADEIIAVMTALRDADPDMEFKCTSTHGYPPFAVDPDCDVARMAGRAAEAVLGAVVFRGAPWSANTGVFTEAGIPSVLFGPGSIAQAHTGEEFVEIEQVVTAAKVYAEMIRQFGREAG